MRTARAVGASEPIPRRHSIAETDWFIILMLALVVAVAALLRPEDAGCGAGPQALPWVRDALAVCQDEGVRP